ncbi:hypothetical protein FHS19_006890 [Paenibacillus rhizosphaerae]|uniref:Uncharacterized protein n=1 Tax=Paenibacillus rhizosphaerae TaxID=297318 RepID=A0A839U087_9BACL|nr:hypothetical protein [Paenibacillus rhizosphaerae]MBB3132163.1 hypothetical protein [Paenibacillus rhizosphaerae]
MGYKYGVVEAPMVYRNMYEPNSGVTIDSETVIVYDDETREIFMPEKYKGKLAYLADIKEIPETELTNLWRNSQMIARQRDEAIDDLARHAQTIVDLQNEKLRLQQEVDRARSDQKVELPRNVAEALDRRFKIEGADWPEVIYDSFTHQADPTKGIITNFAADNFPDFICALVNGYTFKLEPRDKVKQFIEKWYAVPGDVTDSELYELSDGIIDVLQKSS